MNRSSIKIFVGLLAFVACGCSHPNPSPPQTDCAADDARVGYVAELTGRMHGISGTARVVDNCTIAIEHFNYDGLAADPRVVGVTNNDFVNCAVLTSSILRVGGYQDETLTVRLPIGVTLDDVPMISICCLSGNDVFGYGNLGEGIFHAPGTPQPDPLTYWNNPQ